ncbi:hypothetical protein RJT34_02251 [Clitoria ternatea]|uniref:Uncharacterized protein n=1 Tax=Clitoria ternatea TaxID=43366 RepID=A0AAN9KHK6_CLITE
MDSLFSLQTPTDTLTHPTPFPPPGIPSPPASSVTSEASLPTLLVPKPEPYDDFLATQDHQQHDGGSDADEELHLYSEFNRISELFRFAFGKAFDGAMDIAALTDPNLSFGDVKVSCPNLPQDVTPFFQDPNWPPKDVHVDPHSLGEEEDADVSDPSSRAIVPVPPQQQERTVTVSRRGQSRRKELVRVTDITAKDQMHFREVVRKTRMIFDSLRVLTSIEEEKRVAAAAAAAAAAEALASQPAEASASQPAEQGEASNTKSRRLRGDLRAAALLRDRGLWLNRDKRIVGAIPGIFVGDLFLFRMELCVVGLHGQIQAGIDYLPGSMSPNGEPIATSVIVSGGYEDDMDDGEVIVYTGHGGQEKNSSRQVCDQKLESGNLALERSMRHGIEVRVIRGMRYEGSASASGKVYMYDGLYKIVDCWFDVGKSGFGVFKFKLWRIEGQPKMGSAILKEARNVRRSGLDSQPLYCLAADMANQKENVPVRLFNDIDDNRDPLCFEYLARTSFPQFVFHQTGKSTGCDCVDGCGDGCFCAMKNGGEFPYTLQGFLVRGKPLIFECGPFCSCPPNCRNRVSQKGLKNRLEVFRSQQTGWGVRSLDLIQAGAFICEYTGVVLTTEQAQILTMNGDSLIYPNRFSERWAEWGDLSQIYSNYVRPSYPSIPPLDFSLDVSTMRNVACYMSHSSSPNVLVQFVLYDHNNLMFPHLMLFAMENIPPMRELSLDYGVADEWTGKLSICN